MSAATSTLLRRVSLARVFRIQDCEGRGPFRPGFSTMWLDDDVGDRVALPSWIEEFGDDAFDGVPDGAHGFSAVRSLDKLCEWFTASERSRLYTFGFSVVEVPNANVIHESQHQVLCWREQPLRFGIVNRRAP